MKKFTPLIITGVIIVLVLLLGSSGCSTYNNFVTLDQNVKNQWSQVEVQYQRRMDLIPNLMRTVQGYAAHESSTFENVTRARAGLDAAYQTARTDSAATPADGAAFEQLNRNQEALNRALSIYVNAVREAYPDLKADTQFLNLQTQLEGTENRISTERGRYNTVVETYNNAVLRFPGRIWAGIFGYNEKAYFNADSEAARAPEVSFPAN